MDVLPEIEEKSERETDNGEEEEEEEEVESDDDEEEEGGDGEGEEVGERKEGELDNLNAAGSENEIKKKKHLRKKKVKTDLDGSALKSELEKIQVESPEPIEPEFDKDELPPSYKEDDSERIKTSNLLAVMKRTIEQFRIFYFDRRPMLLKPRNECDMKRVVMTTINPTQMKYQDMINWQEISSYVAGYLNYSKLKPPHRLPEKLFAPQTVLELKRGHCFEYSTLLCSMLIGSGYDAYVVSGYATREVCNLDLSYTACPIQEQDHIVAPKPMTLNINRYKVKPPRALVSEFVTKMQRREERRSSAIHKAIANNELEEKRIREAPPKDPLHGWRVHSWVMVLAGKRDIRTTFFIEPTSGTAHQTDWDQYLGIESVWNNRNYYINVHREFLEKKVPVTKLTVPKPFLFPLKKMTYDIGDSRNWDYLFQWQDLHREKTREEIKKEITEKGVNPLEERFFDLPNSWTKKLNIPREEYYLKFPTGKKTVRYYKCILEKWADYLQPDGMVQKLWAYNDIQCKNLHYSKEDFLNRADQLKTRYFDQETGKIQEYYNIGRPDFLIEHHYFAHTPGPRTERLIVYEKNRRTDALYRKEEGPNYIRLYYGDEKEDRKYFKETIFGPKGFVREHPAQLANLDNPRPIEALTEKFRRNPEVPAAQDIHRIEFSVVADDICIYYHVEDDRIVGNTRRFVKPAMWWDESQILSWNPDLHRYFEINPYAKQRCETSLFLEMLKHMFEEASTRNHTRKMEKETNILLKVRQREENNVKLEKSYIMAHRNMATRTARLEAKAQEKYARWLSKQDILRDYLDPNIQRVGLDAITNKKQAIKVRDDCVADLKYRLLTQANMMKEDFEREKKKIVAMQLWYHDNFIRLTKEEEESYRSSIMKNMFVAHIIEQRINTHKEYAPVKYQLLIDTIARDARTEPFLI